MDDESDRYESVDTDSPLLGGVLSLTPLLEEDRPATQPSVWRRALLPTGLAAVGAAVLSAAGYWIYPNLKPADAPTQLATAEPPAKVTRLIESEADTASDSFVPVSNPEFAPKLEPLPKKEIRPEPKPAATPPSEKASAKKINDPFAPAPFIGEQKKSMPPNPENARPAPMFAKTEPRKQPAVPTKPLDFMPPPAPTYARKRTEAAMKSPPTPPVFAAVDRKTAPPKSLLEPLPPAKRPEPQDPFGDILRRRPPAPPDFALSQRRTEPTVAPPRVFALARPPFESAPVVLAKSAPQPPSFKPAAAPVDVETIQLAKRVCPTRENFEIVSRDFSMPKRDVYLDPELRAQAPTLRRLEIVEPATPPPTKTIAKAPEPPLAEKKLDPPQPLAAVAAKTPRPSTRPERIELRSIPTVRRLGAPTLLVARVMDGLGQPLPGTMVEWTVDRRGVGHVVVVPESFRSEAMPEMGGEKIAPTFARTLTASKPYFLDVVADESTPAQSGKSIEIRPGEACCYVNSPVAGDMAVAAIAPAIARADRREAVAKIHWTNARAHFATNQRAATGSDIAVATRVVRDDGLPLRGYAVRYRVGPATAKGVVSADFQREVVTDGDGRAVLHRTRPIRDAGLERVEMELLGANPLEGDNAIVLAKGECTIDWYQPKLELTVAPTAIARVGEWATLQIRVDNRDVVPATDLRVETNWSAALSMETANGHAQRATRELGTLAAGTSETWQTAVRSQEPGKHRVRCVLSDGRGARAQAEVVVEFAVPKLALAKRPVIALTVGQRHEHSIVIRNDAPVIAKSVEVEDDLPPEVSAEVVDGMRLMDRMLWRVGDLKPGETRKLTARWTARKPVEPLALRARATEAGSSAVVAESYGRLAVRGFPALAVAVLDSQDPVEIGKTAQLTVRVRNRGTAAAEAISLAGVLPPHWAFVDSSGPLQAQHADGRLRFETIARLEPGETIEGVIQVRSTKPGEARTSIRLFHEAVGPAGIETQESTSIFAP